LKKKALSFFLIEFRDVFSNEVIAENCKVGEHVIKIKDSSPIKQSPLYSVINAKGGE